jgi:cytochrome c5
MMNQPSIKPQETQDGVIFSFPKRSIPITGRPTKVADRVAADSLKNPIEVSASSIKKGKQLYTMYCSACHGMNGKAEAPLSKLIFAADLTSPRIQYDLSEGWIWGTITFGSAIMPAYGVVGEQGGGSNDLNPEERWHVVNFVRNALEKQPRDAPSTGTSTKPASVGNGEVSIARGESVYSNVCIACHSSSMSPMTKAPAMGDYSAWKDRIAQGRDILFQHATTQPGYVGPNGGFMPARGGRPELTDEEIKSVIEFFISSAEKGAE